MKKDIINIGYRYNLLKKWIEDLLTLGTSGLELITGGKAGQE